MSWSEEQTAFIERRWAEGASAGFIARELGTKTRSAVLGKLNRLGLCGTRPTSREASIAPRTGSLRKRKPRAPKLQPMKVEPVYIPTETVPFRDWKLNQCAFIAGEVKGPDTLYCGSMAAFGSSWCRYHIGIVWAGILPKKDRRSENGRKANSIVGEAA